MELLNFFVAIISSLFAFISCGDISLLFQGNKAGFVTLKCILLVERGGGGENRQGSLNFPLPILYLFVPVPALFLLAPAFLRCRFQNIALCCMIFPYFSSVPPWESRVQPPLFPPPLVYCLLPPAPSPSTFRVL